MSTSTLRRAAFGLTLFVTAPALWALPTLYHLQDLGAGSEAVHLNAKGQAAGTDTTGGQHHAAVWTDGIVKWLGEPATLGSAYWINAAGAVVGEASTGYGMAALWTRSGKYTNLDRQGFAGSEATAINDKRDCVMNGAADAETLVAYLLTGCHPYDYVEMGAFMRGVAINAEDQVALTEQYGEDPQRAKLYSNGALQDLGVLAGYSQSIASDLNNDGHVVGTSADGVYDLREGFFWNGRKLLKVGALGGERSEANAVNAHDVVVGSAQTRKGEWHPFVRDMGAPGARPEDLQTMLDSSGTGWSLDSALSINKSGQILVRGTAPGDSTPRSAILTPVD